MIMERFEGLVALSVEEKAQLADELWRSLDGEKEVPEQHLRVLEEREAKYGDSLEGVPLSEAMERLRNPEAQAE